MSNMKYALLQTGAEFEFVEMPATHLYQLTALNARLHKELIKLTADNVPALGVVIAECEKVDVVPGETCYIKHGLDYMNGLVQSFSVIEEKTYPLVSLLTEIRALQAQLEQWYDEEYSC